MHELIKALVTGDIASSGCLITAVVGSAQPTYRQKPPLISLVAAFSLTLLCMPGTVMAAKNSPPVVTNDYLEIPVHFAPLSIPASFFLANDYDPDGDELFIMGTGGVLHRDFRLDYLAVYDSGTYGSGGFYVCDTDKYSRKKKPTKDKKFDSEKFGNHCTDSSFDVKILENSPPTPVDDAITIAAGTKLGEVPIGFVLGNDSDPDGDPLYLLISLVSLTREGSFLPNEYNAGNYPDLGQDPEFPAGSYEFPRLVCDRSTESFNASRLPFEIFLEQHCTESTLTIHAVSDHQWRASVSSSDEWCQATNESNSDHLNWTIKALPQSDLVDFVGWSAIDYGAGQDYGPNNPVPAGIYIGEPLTFSCSYRVEWSAYGAVVDHFLSEFEKMNGERLKEPTNQLDWEYANTGSYFAAETDFRDFNARGQGLMTSVLLTRCYDPAYPPRIVDGVEQGNNVLCLNITDAGQAGWVDYLCEKGSYLDTSKCEGNVHGEDDQGLTIGPTD